MIGPVPVDGDGPIEYVAVRPVDRPDADYIGVAFSDERKEIGAEISYGVAMQAYGQLPIRGVVDFDPERVTPDPI